MNAIKEYYYNLNTRERYMVLTMIIAIAVFVPYQFIWTPFVEGLEESEQRVTKQRVQYQEMQQVSAELKQLRGGAGIATRTGKQFLFGAINNAARKFGLANAVNVKGDSNDRVRVLMENVPFDNVLRWLDELQHRQGLTIVTINVDQVGSIGMVKANVLLEAS